MDFVDICLNLDKGHHFLWRVFKKLPHLPKTVVYIVSVYFMSSSLLVSTIAKANLWQTQWKVRSMGNSL